MDHYTLNDYLIDSLNNTMSEESYNKMVINKTLSEELIFELKDKLDWRLVFNFQPINEKFLLKVIKYARNHWQLILENIPLSSEFLFDHICEFDDYAMLTMCEYQTLSDDFIIENMEYFSIDCLNKIILNQNISDDLYITISNIIERS